MENCTQVEYDFEFYKLEMAADVQMLVLSEGKSNILPADLVLPFQPTLISSEVIASAEQLQAWRWYLATLRSLPYSNGPETLQVFFFFIFPRNNFMYCFCLKI